MIAAPNHEEFLEELRRGHRRELYVGALLLETGLAVQVPLLEEAATPWEGKRFAEQRDVIVDGLIVEVKGRTCVFTCAEDFPYPTVNICTVKRWEARREKPVAFVMVSLPTHALLVVSSRTFKTWEIADSRDGRRDGWVTPTYRAPKEHLRPFADLVEALRGRA